MQNLNVSWLLSKFTFIKYVVPHADDGMLLHFHILLTKPLIGYAKYSLAESVFGNNRKAKVRRI